MSNRYRNDIESRLTRDQIDNRIEVVKTILTTSIQLSIRPRVDLDSISMLKQDRLEIESIIESKSLRHRYDIVTISFRHRYDLVSTSFRYRFDIVTISFRTHLTHFD